MTYPQYVMELTYLLFLKIVSERPESELALPSDIGWKNLSEMPDLALLDRYRDTLAMLGRTKEPRVVQSIFAGATTVVRSSETLRKLIEAIDSADWYSDTRDTFGDAYGRMRSHTLWQASQLPIERFYHVLRPAVESGQIRTSKDKDLLIAD